MDSNTVAIVSVSVTGALAFAQLFTTWLLATKTQRHQTELATIESNRDDVKNAHAALYRKLASYLRAATAPVNPNDDDGRPGPEPADTWQEFDEELNEVWLMASPQAAGLGSAAVAAIADLAQHGHEESDAARASYSWAEKAIATYRAAIRRDRGLE